MYDWTTDTWTDDAQRWTIANLLQYDAPDALQDEAAVLQEIDDTYQALRETGLLKTRTVMAVEH